MSSGRNLGTQPFPRRYHHARPFRTLHDFLLASDLWSVDKSLTPMTSEEKLAAWRTTTGMLDSLCEMADSLMLDPMIFALADASGRAREEELRAEDQLTRPDGVELGPREEQRL